MQARTLPIVFVDFIRENHQRGVGVLVPKVVHFLPNSIYYFMDQIESSNALIECLWVAL